eukprot:scaffold131183_cov21-Phaeocystis_antarctica.AAC.1
MENWVADSKRGPLQHEQEKSEKMRQETPCNTLGDTREGISHNATKRGGILELRSRRVAALGAPLRARACL